MRRLIEPTSGQEILLVEPNADEVTFRFIFADHPGSYPEAIFNPAPSRYTRAAVALVDEAQQIAGTGDGLTRAIRIARAVAERFDYGHPDQKFNDGFDHVPHLSCGLTQGSCVDIHTYFLASLRAAGIEAGYVVGYFFPEVGDCTSGHCWAVTRIDGQVQEWDISHYLQIGRRDVGPALNPKGGFRVPVGHSTALCQPEIGFADLKLLVEPMHMIGGEPVRFETKRIRLLLPTTA
ncbi:transglutaminase-like domain-containing protein [Yoonia sp.]|uniref:transglutaminase-like domain-containing protein n=1 Tax=Yoonia sp. TaxID=2212373 RepID=UPI002FD87C59